MLNGATKHRTIQYEVTSEALSGLRDAAREKGHKPGVVTQNKGVYTVRCRVCNSFIVMADGQVLDFSECDKDAADKYAGHFQWTAQDQKRYDDKWKNINNPKSTQFWNPNTSPKKKQKKLAGR